jgi:hypothetical protein
VRFGLSGRHRKQHDEASHRHAFSHKSNAPLA